MRKRKTYLRFDSGVMPSNTEKRDYSENHFICSCWKHSKPVLIGTKPFCIKYIIFYWLEYYCTFSLTCPPHIPKAIARKSADARVMAGWVAVGGRALKISKRGQEVWLYHPQDYCHILPKGEMSLIDMTTEYRLPGNPAMLFDLKYLIFVN